MNQFVTAETNRTAATVVKLLEYVLGHRYTEWMDSFYNSPELTQFMKSKKQAVLELYMLPGKMFLL
jgi:hypothetical protein